VSYADMWVGTGGITAWSIFFGGLLVIVLNARESSIVSRIFSSPSLRFCGQYSYGIYVFHQPLILALVRVGVNSANLTRLLGSKILAVLAIYVVVFVLVVLISLTSWHLFEKHFLKLKDLLPVGVPQGWPARTSSPGVPAERIQPEFAGVGLVRGRDTASRLATRQ
jgi:peptidoglycan/LPS O-acetylase OafA/YrhL